MNSTVSVERNWNNRELTIAVKELQAKVADLEKALGVKPKAEKPPKGEK